MLVFDLVLKFELQLILCLLYSSTWTFSVFQRQVNGLDLAVLLCEGLLLLLPV